MEVKKNHKPLILASKSPRRLELLQSAGLNPIVIESRLSEPKIQNETPEEYAKMLSYFKAFDVAQQKSMHWVIGADTIVVNKGKILFKPKSKAEAYEMISSLRGTIHEVITGFSLIDPHMEKITTLSSITKVRFRNITEDEINWYISTSEPYDKSGGYGIQGKAACFVESLEGSYTNVVGLPLSEVIELMKKERIIE